MVAYGAGSVLCSLFSGYITAASVARSMVQDGAGGRTQVASLFGCLVVLVVIVAVGPLFYSLPKVNIWLLINFIHVLSLYKIIKFSLVMKPIFIIKGFHFFLNFHKQDTVLDLTTNCNQKKACHDLFQRFFFNFTSHKMF